MNRDHYAGSAVDQLAKGLLVGAMGLVLAMDRGEPGEIREHIAAVRHGLELVHELADALESAARVRDAFEAQGRGR